MLYAAIDWGKDPTTSIKVVLGGVFLMVPVLHSILCILSALRDLLASRYQGPNTYSTQTMPTEVDTAAFTMESESQYLLPSQEK